MDVRLDPRPNDIFPKSASGAVNLSRVLGSIDDLFIYAGKGGP